MPTLPAAKNAGDAWDSTDYNTPRTAFLNGHRDSTNNEHVAPLALGDPASNGDRAVAAKRLGGDRTVQWTEANSRWELNNGAGLLPIATGTGTTGDASSIAKGVAKLSKDPTVATDPIALGINGGVLTGDLDFNGKLAQNVVIDARGANPGTSVVGQQWFRTDEQAPYVQALTGRRALQGRVFLATADSTAVVNTAVSTLFDVKYSVPLNSLVAGMMVKVRASGSYSCTGTPTATLLLQYGAIALVTAGPLTCQLNAANAAWELSGEFTVRTGGATGAAVTEGRASLATGTGTASTGLGRAAPAPNFTATADLGVAWQWSAADVANTAKLEQLSVEV